MELEIFNELYDYFYWEYAVLIFCGVEFFKLFIVKIKSGKYVFIFDTEQKIKFNLRVAIVIISILYGLVIVAFERNADIVFSLLITFCITTTFYDYIFKKYTK